MHILRKFFLSLFIMGCLFSFGRWPVFPEQTTVAKFFSFDKRWKRFELNLAQYNLFLVAQVTFDDNSTDTYVFPRFLNAFSLLDSVRAEKIRSFLLHLDGSPDKNLLKDLSKFALRQLKSENFRKLPLQVELILQQDNLTDFEGLSKRIFTYEVL